MPKITKCKEEEVIHYSWGNPPSEDYNYYEFGTSFRGSDRQLNTRGIWVKGTFADFLAILDHFNSLMETYEYYSV
jgi:hypothetical protein